MKNGTATLELAQNYKKAQKAAEEYGKTAKDKLEEQLSKIEEQLEDDKLSVSARAKLINKANDLQKQLDDLSNHNDLTIPAKVEPKYIVKGTMDDKRQSTQNAYNQINDIADDYDLGLIDYETATKQISVINKQLVDLGAKPYMIEIESTFGKKLESFMNGANQFNDVVSGIDNVVGSFDRLTTSIEDGANGWEIFMNAVSAAMSVLNTISTIMTIVDGIQMASNITNGTAAALKSKEAIARSTNSAAQTAELGTLSGLMAVEGAAIVPTIALATATKQLAAAQIFLAHAAIPFAGVPIASGFVATMEGVLAGITAFANGGIVQGKTTIGDYNLARVNGGEMILNTRQQKNLFNMIDKNRIDNTVSIVGGDIKIKGSDLYLSLKNLNKTLAMKGKNIGIR